MTTADAVIRDLNGAAELGRQEDLIRLLRSLRATYGKLTASMIISREGWTPRSVGRYLSELEAAGLVEPVGRSVGKEPRWRITAAGKNHLQSVTSGDWATTVETQSPGSTERDQHNGN